MTRGCFTSVLFLSVVRRIESGGRGIDCAWDYFNQGKVAEAIKASGVPRSELFITTKIPGAGDPLVKVKADLKQLGIEYVEAICHSAVLDALRTFV
jgi:diketogulonate reductase-like aldo/keto reductase